MPNKKRGRQVPKRNLIRWSVEINCYLLLAIQSAANARGQRLPWEDIATILGDLIGAPTITDGAISQHLAKIRKDFKKAGKNVPLPLRRHGGSGIGFSTMGCGVGARARASKPNNAKQARRKDLSDHDQSDDEGSQTKPETIIDKASDKASDSEDEYEERPSKRAKRRTKQGRKVKKVTKKDDETGSDNDEEVREGPSAVALGKRRRTSVSPKRGRRSMATRGYGSMRNYAETASDDITSDEDSITSDERVRQHAESLQFSASDEEEINLVKKQKKNVILWSESKTKEGQNTKMLTVRFHTKKGREGLQKIVGDDFDAKEGTLAGAADTEVDPGEPMDTSVDNFAELASPDQFDNSAFGGPADEFGYSASEPVDTFNTNTSNAGPSSYAGGYLDGFQPSQYTVNPALLEMNNSSYGGGTLDRNPSSFDPFMGGPEFTTVGTAQVPASSQSAGPSGSNESQAAGTSSEHIIPGFSASDLDDMFISNSDLVSSDPRFMDYFNFDPEQ